MTVLKSATTLALTASFLFSRYCALEVVKKKGRDFLPLNTLERAKNGNNIEKIKLKKDPSEIWDDVMNWASAIRAGETNWEDIASDDIDVRVKYAGFFHRKKATPGKFMIRLRIPNGIVNSEQMRYFAEAVKPYGPELGVVDITTRMNIQLRSLPLEDATDALKKLQHLQLTSVMSGLDNLRNMVGSPIAGIDPYEILDTRIITKQIDDWYTNHGMGNPEWANLPRKFNIAISGSRDDFSHTHINDIGLQACLHAKTGEAGFNVVIGGYMSIKRVAHSIPIDVWIPEEDAVDFCKAVLTVFRNEGSRGDRQKTRLMWLIEEKTLPVFVEMIASQMASSKGCLPVKFEPAQEQRTEWVFGHRDVLGVHPQKQEGLSWVGVHVPVGRLSSEECVQIAEIADKYSGGEIRLTVEQNFLLPNVENSKINALLNEPIFTKEDTSMRLSPFPGNLVGRLVSCTGAQFCPVAIIETKIPIESIVCKLEQIVEAPRPIRIHATGCPNSCGQAQVADIGLMGAPAKKANAEGVMKAVQGVNIFIGGKIGEEPFLQVTPNFKGIPLTEEDLLPILAQIIVQHFNGKLKKDL